MCIKASVKVVHRNNLFPIFQPPSYLFSENFLVPRLFPPSRVVGHHLHPTLKKKHAGTFIRNILLFIPVKDDARIWYKITFCFMTFNASLR